MSARLEVRRQSAGSSTSSTRRGLQVALVVLHSNPDPSYRSLVAFGEPGAFPVPHYYVGALGELTQVVAEDRAAHHSGIAVWQSRRRNIDRISIGIMLEHTSGSAYTDAQLVTLHRLLEHLHERYELPENALVRWEATGQGANNTGTITPVRLPFAAVMIATPDPSAAVLGEDTPAAYDEAVITCVPPPTPEIPPFGGMVLGGAVSEAHQDQQLWDLLQQETYRQRGEGFQSGWAFHLHAVGNALGAPLALSANAQNQLVVDGKRYGFQPFGNDTLFNEIPKWAEVRSLNAALNGAIPASGLARRLLEASYQAAGAALHPGWSFHQVAVRERLGPPLGGSYRINVDGQVCSIQVFACDTLYTLIADPESQTRWGDVRRLSDLHNTPGKLRDALWRETYKPSGGTYQPDAPLHALAARDKLGTPLSGAYSVLLGNVPYAVQVFAVDTVFAGPDGAPRRLSALTRPTRAAQRQKPQPHTGAPFDPHSNNRPLFSQLPLPLDARPVVSQFFGFTKFAKQNGARFYSQTQGRHSGIDIGVQEGTRLLAMTDGVVFCAGRPGVDCRFGGSPPLVIVVRYGSVYAVYGHCSEVRVRQGQVVRPGDVIGLSGTFNGPHLHFEIRPVSNPAQAFNPLEFFTPELSNSFFEPQLHRNLGGVAHFCCGNLFDQPLLEFGKQIDTRPCER